MKGVYLLHIEPNYKGCSHYIGYSSSIEKRFLKHVEGKGTPLIKAAVNSGSHILLVRTWKDQDRDFERGLKNRRKSKDLCPHCNKNWRNNAKIRKCN